MAMYCFGCGFDITDSRVKRSLYSDASEHVIGRYDVKFLIWNWLGKELKCKLNG